MIEETAAQSRSKPLGDAVRYTFRTALTGNLLFPLLQCLGLCGAFPLMIYLVDIRRTVQEAGAAALRRQYQFIFMTGWDDIWALYIVLFIAAMSVLTGIGMFRFITNKKMSSVIYSLGISRRSLFLAKYTAGLVLLALSVLLPMALDFLLNLAVFGSSSLLWKVALYDTIGLLLLSFLIYTITAAIFSAAGSTGEGLFFSIAAAGLPTIVLFCLQSLMERLVWGNPFGHLIENHTYTSLIDRCAGWNPLLFMQKPLLRYGMADAAGKLIPRETAEALQWSDLSFAAFVPWLLFLLVLLAVALLVFQRRRAEICGFIGANKALNSASVFLIGFAAFCLILRYTSTLPLALSVLIGALVYLALYGIIDAILLRDRRQFVRGLVKLPFHAAAMTVLTLVFATGLFGFVTRIPAVEKIDSIKITGAAFQPFADWDANHVNNSSYGDGIQYYSGAIQYSATASERDQELVRSLHQHLIDARTSPRDSRIKTAICVSYQLKNGKEVQRFYSASIRDAVASLLRLEETDALRNATRDNLSAEPKASDYSEESTQSAYWEDQTLALRFGFETSMLSFLSPDLTVSTLSPLDRDRTAALKQALIQDLNAQTVQQRYNSQEKALGVLCFQQTVGHPRSSFGGGPMESLANPMGNKSYAVIMPDMVHTVDFLRTHDLLRLFDSDRTIVAAHVTSVAALYQNVAESWPQFLPIYEFGACYDLKTPKFDSYQPYTDTITQAEELAELDGRSLLHAFTRGEGYFVCFTLSGGGTLTKYLPQDRAPRFITEHL